jgi:AcrR family transcriptional regulator
MTTVTTDRRTEIVDAAARLFFTRGYGGTSVQDVADEVGILKGSLYHHIDAKDDLLVAVIDEVHDAAMARLAAAESREGSVVDRLVWFLRDHTAYNCRHVERIGVYFRAVAHLTGDRRARVAADRRTYDRHVRSMIEAGRASGEIPTTVDPRLTANALLGMTNWVYQWFDPASNDADDVADGLAALAADMLGRAR